MKTIKNNHNSVCEFCGRDDMINCEKCGERLPHGNAYGTFLPCNCTQAKNFIRNEKKEIKK